MTSQSAVDAQNTGSRRKRGLLARLLGAAVALVLLWMVARNVPWDDVLVMHVEQAGETVHELSFTGEIEGDWKTSSVRFVADLPSVWELREERPQAWSALPEALRHELQGEHPLTLRENSLTLAAGTAIGFPLLEWRPAIGRVFGDLQWTALLPAMGLLFLCSVFIVTRWWRLLAVMGCATRWMGALRVTYVGLFFNVLVPGSSGGDLARVWLVIKGHPESRPQAFMSVILDRVLGLAAMGLLAAGAVLGNDSRFEILRLPVSLVALAMIAGLLAMGSQGLRRLIRLDAILKRLPQGERLARMDAVLCSFASRPGEVLLALALSIGNHVGASMAVATLGTALGADLSLLDYVCIATVVNTLTAVPISPGGLGVGEVLSGSLFVLAGESLTLGVATSVTYRICLALLGLAGGVVLLAPGGRQLRGDFETASRELAGEGPGV